MTTAQYHEVVDNCIAEYSSDTVVQDCLDDYHNAHILITVVDVVSVAEGEVYEDVLEWTLQQLKDGIPA